MPEGTPRARGPYRTGIRRREQLIAVAIAVFGGHGFAGASLRVIAEQADVSHATLIRYFGSKEGLLAAVLEEWDRRTVENSLADVSGLDYFRRLPHVMAVHQENRGLSSSSPRLRQRHPARRIRRTPSSSTAIRETWSLCPSTCARRSRPATSHL